MYEPSNIVIMVIGLAISLLGGGAIYYLLKDKVDIFYTSVLIIASIFLIIALTFFGIILKTQKASSIFPPSTRNCPDYWTFDGSLCVFNNFDTSLNIGTYTIRNDTTIGKTIGLSDTDSPFSTDASHNTFSPTNSSWSSLGMSAVCAQQQWANKNRIVWDGISNYNGC